MKIFLSAGEPLTHSRAWSYALLNQLATPGLGTLLARRFIAGSLQLTLSVAGFFCVMFWFFQIMKAFYGQMTGATASTSAANTAGWAGLWLFVAAWFWSLISSVQIMRSVPKNCGLVPPKIV